MSTVMKLLPTDKVEYVTPPAPIQPTPEPAMMPDAGVTPPPPRGQVMKLQPTDKVEYRDAPQASLAPSKGEYTNLLNNDIGTIVGNASRLYGVDPNLLRSVIQQESSGDPNAESRKGAQGLMQLMPGTAKDLGVSNPYDPNENVMGGTKYLAQQLKAFGGDTDLALAAYNWGPENVSKRLRKGMTKEQILAAAPEETKGYVARIKQRMEREGRIAATTENMQQSTLMNIPIIGPAVAGVAQAGADLQGVAERVTDFAGVTDRSTNQSAEDALISSEAFARAQPGMLPQTISGVTRSLTNMAPAIGVGMVNPIAGAALAAGIPAVTTYSATEQATGDTSHAIRQGLIEGGITGAMQAIGLGGMEKAASKGFRIGLKALGIDTLAELGEENAIQVFQNVERWYTNNFDPEKTMTLAEALEGTKQATIQTIATLGLVRGSQAAASRVLGRPVGVEKTPPPAGATKDTSDSIPKQPWQMTRDEYDQWRVDELNRLNPQLNGALRLEILNPEDQAARGSNDGAGGTQVGGHSGSTITRSSDAPSGTTSHEVRHLIDLLLGGKQVTAYIGDIKKRGEAAFQNLKDYLLSGRKGGKFDGRVTNDEETAQFVLDAFYKDREGLRAVQPDIVEFLEQMGADKYAHLQDSHAEMVRKSGGANGSIPGVQELRAALDTPGAKVRFHDSNRAVDTADVDISPDGTMVHIAGEKEPISVTSLRDVLVRGKRIDQTLWEDQGQFVPGWNIRQGTPEPGEITGPLAGLGQFPDKPQASQNVADFIKNPMHTFTFAMPYQNAAGETLYRPVKVNGNMVMATDATANRLNIKGSKSIPDGMVDANSLLRVERNTDRLGEQGETLYENAELSSMVAASKERSRAKVAGIAPPAEPKPIDTSLYFGRKLYNQLNEVTGNTEEADALFRLVQARAEALGEDVDRFVARHGLEVQKALGQAQTVAEAQEILTAADGKKPTREAARAKLREAKQAQTEALANVPAEKPNLEQIQQAEFFYNTKPVQNANQKLASGPEKTKNEILAEFRRDVRKRGIKPGRDTAEDLGISGWFFKKDATDSWDQVVQEGKAMGLVSGDMGEFAALEYLLKSPLTVKQSLDDAYYFQSLSKPAQDAWTFYGGPDNAVSSLKRHIFAMRKVGKDPSGWQELVNEFQRVGSGAAPDPATQPQNLGVTETPAAPELPSNPRQLPDARQSALATAAQNLAAIEGKAEPVVSEGQNKAFDRLVVAREPMGIVDEPVVFQSVDGTVITKSARSPGMWQATSFTTENPDIPRGHQEYESLTDALYENTPREIADAVAYPREIDDFVRATVGLRDAWGKGVKIGQYAYSSPLRPVDNFAPGVDKVNRFFNVDGRRGVIFRNEPLSFSDMTRWQYQPLSVESRRASIQSWLEEQGYESRGQVQGQPVREQAVKQAGLQGMDVEGTADKETSTRSTGRSSQMAQGNQMVPSENRLGIETSYSSMQDSDGTWMVLRGKETIHRGLANQAQAEQVIAAEETDDNTMLFQKPESNKSPWEMTRDEFHKGRNLHGSYADPRQGRASSGDTSGFFTTPEERVADFYANSDQRNEIANAGKIYAADPPKNLAKLDNKNHLQALRKGILKQVRDGGFRTQKAIERLDRVIANEQSNSIDRVRAIDSALRNVDVEYSMEMFGKISNPDKPILNNAVRNAGFDAFETFEKAPFTNDATHYPVHVYVDRPELINHKEVIESALASGKSVPPAVLSEYPDLAAKYKSANSLNLLQQGPKGSVEFLEDGRTIIKAFESADVSTIAHELGHVFRRDISGPDLTAAAQWAGAKNGVWDTDAEEKFARGFERYLRNGKAPTPELRTVFQKFRDWLHNIYKTLRGTSLAVNMTPEMIAVYDNMFKPQGKGVVANEKQGQRQGRQEVLTPGRGAEMAPSPATAPPVVTAAQVPPQPMAEAAPQATPQSAPMLPSAPSATPSGNVPAQGGVSTPPQPPTPPTPPQEAIQPGADERNRANPGMTNDVRQWIIRERNADPELETRPFAQAQAEADLLDPAVVAEKVKRGEILSDSETWKARSLINDAALKAFQTGSEADMEAASQLRAGFDAGGTAWGQSGASRRDSLLTPEQRKIEVMNTVFFQNTEKSTVRLRQITEKLKRPDVSKRERFNLEKERDGIVKREAARRKKIYDKMIKEGYPLQDPDALKDPDVVSSIIRRRAPENATKWDKAHELWLASVLGNPATQTANVAGNALNATWDFTVQRMAEAMVNTVARNETGAQWGEFQYLVKGMKPGFRRGVRNMLQSWRTELPAFEAQVGGPHNYSKIETLKNPAIGGAKGRVIRAPLRALMAMDEFSKSMAAEMEAHAQAYRSGKAQGLQGDALAAHIAKEVGDLQSDAWRLGVEKAEELTFQAELGRGGKAIMYGRDAVPGARYILPFVRTPINIFKTGLAKTPLGTLRLLQRMAMDKEYTGRVLQRDIAQQAIAWGMAFGLGEALGLFNDEENGEEPFVTGTLPYTPGKQGAREIAMGAAPPMSIRIGDTWYSYARIEPIATMLGTTVDLINNIKQVKNGRDATAALGAFYSHFISQAKDKTFLRGLGDIIDATENPKSLASWASNFAASWVPNYARAGLGATQDTLKETNLTGDLETFGPKVVGRTLERMVPGQPMMPQRPKINLWGEEVTKDNGKHATTDWLYRLTVPSQTVDLSERDPLALQLDRAILNWNNANPDETFAPQRPSVSYQVTEKGKETTKYWSDAQYEELSRLTGAIALDALEKRADKINFDKPTAQQIKMIRSVLEQARARAKRQVLRQAE